MKLALPCLFLCLAATFSAVDSMATDIDLDLTDLTLDELLNIEVSVASQFKETELESGSTVEVITKEQWSHYGAENLGDVIGHQPGVMVYPTAWGGSAVAIRGYTSSLSVRGIATVLDGIPLNSLRNGTGLYDIRSVAIQGLDQIEMIRGPGSALYGSDAFHGVISMKTYSSDQNNLEAGISLSSEEFRHVNLGFTRVFNNRYTFELSLAGIDQGDQGIEYNYTSPFTRMVETSDRENSFEAYTAAVKLRAKHKDTFSTDYAVYFKGHDSVESVSGGQSLSGNSIFLDRDITDGIQDTVIAKVGFNWDLKNSVNVQGKLYSWEDEVETFTDLSTIPTVGLGGENIVEEEQSGVDLVVKQSENPWNLQWAIGYSYKTMEVPEEVSYFTTGPDRIRVGEQPIFLKGVDRDINSLIYEAKAKFLKNKFQVLFGGRYDDYSDFGGQNSPRFGLIYMTTPKSSLKALYGEAFRAPTAAEFRGTILFRGSTDLAPEVIKTFEAVFQYQSDSWKLNITAFRSKWTDGIILVPIEHPIFTNEYQNVGENESDGFEISFKGGQKNWRWDLNGSRVESEAIFASGAVGYDAFPKSLVNFNLGYVLPKHNLDFYLTNRAWFDATEGPTTGLVPNPRDLDDFYATDLSVTWTANDKLQLQGAIRNLFDQDNFVPSVWNAENGHQTLGQFLHVRLNYKF
ncbi:TonB-dependent receptor [Sulfidibacter corallicola]|uniref:TonB-dependent receptor n=1 Tax=Sulfidibacter corallicola TaxID=2818388 RepID=A0A8A4TLV8_SULCO|nr:TonB-dependent receptor [Sulfidibacter corallicola]QTD50194.1 TonB-dependent receptor [Sulfidibacter corallicola]